MYDARESLAAKVKLVRFLLSKSDNRGLSHGEKHYFIQTALMLLHEVQRDIDDNHNIMERHQIEDYDLSLKNIPFVEP